MSRQPSLLRKMVLWQVGAMLVAWVVLTAWLVTQMMAVGDGDLDRRMMTFARILAETGSASDDAALARRLRATQRIFVDGVISGFDAIDDYVPLYRVESSGGALRYASDGAADLPISGTPDRFAEVDAGGHRYRTVTVASDDGRTRVSMAERADQRLNSPALKVIGLGQLLILAWCLTITIVAARRGFRPLTALAKQLSSRPAGDLAPLHATHLYAETAPVVHEVNALLAREADRLASERGFLADAAHELRTPLAAIAAQAHLLARTADPSTRAIAFSELTEGVDRVSHLLRQLLTIARLEAASSGAVHRSLDIVELCRQRVAALARFARTRGVEVVFESPTSSTLDADRGHLISVIDNLVDNAIRYAPRGGRVEVRLVERIDSVELRVQDDGPGIPPPDRQRVFERFVRLAHHVESGSGLGLAIVRRAVDAESATLRWIEGLRERGVGFAVVFRRLP